MTPTVRQRALEAMELAEHYREENRALKERIAQLEALMLPPRYVNVTPSSWDSIYIGHGTDGLGRPIPMGCTCPRCTIQIT